MRITKRRKHICFHYLSQKEPEKTHMSPISMQSGQTIHYLYKHHIVILKLRARMSLYKFSCTVHMFLQTVYSNFIDDYHYLINNYANILGVILYNYILFAT